MSLCFGEPPKSKFTTIITWGSCGRVNFGMDEETAIRIFEKIHPDVEEYAVNGVERERGEVNG